MGQQTLQKEQQDMISVMTQALPYLRRELHISQTDLAEKVGVSRQTISLIERGEQNMTWTLFLNGDLWIQGFGAMEDYPDEWDVPWRFSTP